MHRFRGAGGLRKSTGGSVKTPREAHGMERFDSAVPIRMCWSDREGDQGVWPECGATVQPEYYSYVAAVKDGDDFEVALIKSEKDSFCPQCPVVVLDIGGLAEIIDGSGMGSDSASFTGLGVVDLKAVSEEKKGAPFDEKDNPIPLVEFLPPQPELCRSA